MGRGTTAKQFAEEMAVLLPRMIRMFLARQTTMIRRSGDITMPQIAILHLLKDIPRCKMSEIAKFLTVTTSAATGIVDRMVRSGLLKRMREPKDRRIINIKLTPKGEKTINAIFRERQRMMMDIFKRFDPKEREAYLDTVKKMYAILTGER